MWIVLVLPGGIAAQTMLNQPESVAFDHQRNRHLVSNYADGIIVSIDSLGQESSLNTDLTHAVGLHIIGDTLFAASHTGPNAGLAGINLVTGVLDFVVPLPHMMLPNGVASDSSGNVYVTDSEGDRLYRIRISDLDCGVFVDTGNAAYTGPNGIVFDPYNNRMLVICDEARNSPIVAIGVTDTVVSVVVRTRLSSPGLDGLTSDNNGYTYVSSWYTNSIYRYGPDFINPPLEIASGFRDPADIQFNEYLDQISVPCFNGDTLRVVPVNTTSVGESEGGTPPSPTSLDNICPNPFNPKTEIRFSLSEPCRANLVIYDVIGRQVRLLVSGNQDAGMFTKEWFGLDDSGRAVSSGVYFARLETERYSEGRKLVLIR